MLRFNQTRPVEGPGLVTLCHLAAEPFDRLLGQRLALGVGMSCDRLGVRSADAAGVRAEALVVHGLEVFLVGVEKMLSADVTGGIEERKPHADRDLEKALLLAIGLSDEGGVHGGELAGARQSGCIVPQVGERPLEPFDLEWRDVDQPRGRSTRSLERCQELVDGCELGLAREDACHLELVNEHVEVDARPARNVRRACQQPERREAEREDRPELDDVACALPHRELLRRRLELPGDFLRRPLDAANELDRDPEQVPRRRLVQPRAPDEAWQYELRGLVQRSSDEGRDRPDETLRKGDEEARRASHSTTRRRRRRRPVRRSRSRRMPRSRRS